MFLLPLPLLCIYCLSALVLCRVVQVAELATRISDVCFPGYRFLVLNLSGLRSIKASLKCILAFWVHKSLSSQQSEGILNMSGCAVLQDVNIKG